MGLRMMCSPGWSIGHRMIIHQILLLWRRKCFRLAVYRYVLRVSLCTALRMVCSIYLKKILCNIKSERWQEVVNREVLLRFFFFADQSPSDCYTEANGQRIQRSFVHLFPTWWWIACINDGLWDMCFSADICFLKLHKQKMDTYLESRVRTDSSFSRLLPLVIALTGAHEERKVRSAQQGIIVCAWPCSQVQCTHFTGNLCPSV